MSIQSTCRVWRRRDGYPAAVKRSLWHARNCWSGGGRRSGSAGWAAAGAGREWGFTKRTHFCVKAVWSEGVRDGGSNPFVAGSARRAGVELARCWSWATARGWPERDGRRGAAAPAPRVAGRWLVRYQAVVCRRPVGRVDFTASRRLASIWRRVGIGGSGFAGGPRCGPAFMIERRFWGFGVNVCK